MPLSPRERKECRQIIQLLQRHPSAGPFLSPVDPVKEGIPLYFEVIKNPMDLSTVATKLERKEYGYVEEFVDDVNLIWNNAALFNGENHEVALMGRELERIFNERSALQKGILHRKNLDRNRNGDSAKNVPR
eukprot:TRINITY_DN1828_c0_g1_i18.p1 TRINITY_DN1828_c0_g1~~TRINITY_DN1828_c0_g1_i18.p1  ORF type:complete len:132 (-),score=22.19 TRINITY_DN1828_c0_g1_i18:412-807(-)